MHSSSTLKNIFQKDHVFHRNVFSTRQVQQQVRSEKRDLAKLMESYIPAILDLQTCLNCHSLIELQNLDDDMRRVWASALSAPKPLEGLPLWKAEGRGASRKFFHKGGNHDGTEIEPTNLISLIPSKEFCERNRWRLSVVTQHGNHDNSELHTNGSQANREQDGSGRQPSLAAAIMSNGGSGRDKLELKQMGGKFSVVVEQMLCNAADFRSLDRAVIEKEDNVSFRYNQKKRQMQTPEKQHWKRQKMALQGVKKVLLQADADGEVLQRYVKARFQNITNLDKALENRDSGKLAATAYGCAKIHDPSLDNSELDDDGW